MVTVGLDFGTSNSSIALLQDGHIRMFPLDPGSLNPRMLRSFIFISRSQEHFVGSEAVRKYLELETGRPVFWEMKWVDEIRMVVGGGGSGPIIYWDDLYVQVDTNAQGRLIQSIKTALRNPAYEGTQVFDRYYPVEELIAILLRHLRERCMQELGQDVDGVVLGRPVRFSDEPDVDARAQAKVAQAAALAGFKHIDFEYEPVAAAYVYHRQAQERQFALVFDFGGGTLDFTVMELGGSQPPRVLATAGVLLGGDDLDRTLMRPLRRRFGEGATLRNRQPFPAHLLEYLESWQTMVMLSRPQYREVLRDASRGSDPESIQRLQTLVEKNLGFKLFQQLEQAKINLSSQPTSKVEIIEAGLRLKEFFTLPQFERLIAGYVAQVDAALDDVLKSSGLRADQIQVVLRTGGSAQVPAFIRLLTQKFEGVDARESRLRALSPFETIVGGLAIKAAG